ncbi:MAG: extracellular solute-binding protein [Actinomycetota bacterium]
MRSVNARFILFGLFASASVLLLAACGDDAEDTLQVYTGRHYDLEAAFEAFAEEFDVNIEFLEGSDAELRERIAAEGDDTQADIYMTVDAGNLAIATEQGLFAPLDSSVLEGAIPDELSDPDGYWYALSARARTIVYSTERLSEDEIPTTYEELAEPQWEGRVCLRNSSNAYTQSLVASLIGSLGYDEALDLVTGWADNARIMSNDVIALNSIRDDRCDVAISNHYYLARELEEDPNYPVGLVWANQDDRGVHVNISGAGVLANSDNPELAQQFIEWLATDGQNLFVDGNNEYPVNPDVAPESLIASEFGETFVRDSTNAAEWGLLNPDAVRLLDEAGYE